MVATSRRKYPCTPAPKILCGVKIYEPHSNVMFFNEIPLNSVDPPDNTILEKSTLRRSISDF